MPNPVSPARKVVVFTGAGISAPSGLSTFRDPNGIWSRYKIDEVATPEAWNRNPQKVLEFYNERRAQLASVHPIRAMLRQPRWSRNSKSW